MSPMLRGEAAPLAASALAGVRDTLARDWGHTTLATTAGPLLVIRAPTADVDLLSDLEGAAEALPQIDLNGYRGCVLMGDRGHLGVSVDMLASLIAARQQAEHTWAAEHRVRMPPWGFAVAHLPSDARRRLRCVIRVDARRVTDLQEADFDRMATLLPQMKRASPGSVRPHWVHLIAHEDDVRLDGSRFFTELEQRAARIAARSTRRVAPDDRAQRHEVASANVDRLLSQRAAPPRRDPLAPAETRPPVPRAAREPAPVAPAPAGPPPDERFRAADLRSREVEHLKQLLASGGYETRERLVVQGVPIALAAARPEGYPRRVAVSFWRHLDAETARHLIAIGRGVGAELVLAVADTTGEGVERVTLATNLKVISPDAVRGLRLD